MLEKWKTSILESSKCIHIRPTLYSYFSPQKASLSHKQKCKKIMIRGLLFFSWKMNRVQNNVWYQKYKQTPKPIIIVYLYPHPPRHGVVGDRHRQTDHILGFGTVLIFLSYSYFPSLFRFLSPEEQWRYISDKATKISGLDQRDADVSHTCVKMLLRIS